MKVSETLSLAGWLFVLVCAFAYFIKIVKVDTVSISVFVFIFLFSCFASTASSDTRKGIK